MNLEALLQAQGPVALIVKARFAPVAGQDRFQPAGFPEIGHVIYQAPAANGKEPRPVCIVDSAASMANHLETVCLAGPFDSSLHPDLEGLPHVVCVSDRDASTPSPEDKLNRVVCTTLTEGHRLASDYFLDAYLEPAWKGPEKAGKSKKDAIPAGWQGKRFREALRKQFGIVEVTKDKKYYVYPDDWWTIFETIFSYDPNSLVHGVLFAKEQIKISRLLSASLEAFGARRVGRSGVKFDRLGKTTSGQPIFSVDEETAESIWATFVIDLALLRSYGRDGSGLNAARKRLLLELALWKIRRLTASPFRFRSGCYLECVGTRVEAGPLVKEALPETDIRAAIAACAFDHAATRVYYPASELFKAGRDEQASGPAGENEVPEEAQEPEV